jgi:YbgC/YbaW family acyl-CoA thioester hydrolase
MWGDLDSLGIVFYPRYYEWIDASSHQFFEAVGLDLKALWQDHQILFGLVETSCRYHHPGRYHQRIHILTRIDAMTPKTIDLRHDIELAADSALIAAGLEKRICLDVSDASAIRAVDIPDDIRRPLELAWRD